MRVWLLRPLAALLTTTLVLIASPLSPAQAAGGPNLAAGKTVSASSSNGPYTASNLNDGNQATYWESTNNSFPQWAQVDLGSATAIDQVVLKLPVGWGTRTQTLSVQGGTDGTSFSTLAGSGGHNFDPGSANTVTINFSAATVRFVRINITANTGWPAGQISELEVYGASSGSGNLASGRPMSASSANSPFVTSNANDGNQTTYWESANNAFPQWLQVDLGSSVSVNKVVLKLPASGWATRTETLAVQGSTNGTSFSDLSASAGRTFDPASANTVTITFAQASVRYVRLNITANTGWPAGQIGEFEVYGPGTGGDTQAPTAPSNLAFTETTPGQIKLTWGASTDDIGVTGYDVYANNALLASVAGNILTYTDNQPTTQTVSYFVKAKDAAGNQSPASNTVTRNGSTGPGSNLAVGKPITASSFTFTYVATNANDNDVTTYWEGAGGAYPSVLTVQLGANAVTSSIVLKLNPDAAWSTRTQTIQVLGREQNATSFTQISPSTTYTFNPASGNTVTIPVSATVADVRLSITSNSGAPAGQVAEFQVIGTPAPNPDLVVTALTASPTSPVETDAITLSATVKNNGDAASGATTVSFFLSGTKVGSANVGGLAAGASSTVTANIGTRDAGTYPLTATVDESNTVIEKNEANNGFTGSPLTVRPVDTSDLRAAPTAWSPSNPANGNTVTFTVAIKNQGTIASAGGAHGITLTVINDSGTVVRTLTGSFSGTINAGATTSPVNLGTWTAANGRYTVRTVIAVDGNELAVKQGNNTSDLPLFVGRGANLPYDMYEAEDGVTGGGAQTIGPNRTIGDLAGEASGRRAVTLNTTGAYVEWTTKAQANSLVVRFSIPDGVNSSLNIYVDGSFLKAINLTSKYAWLYGAEASPNNSPGPGPRHIYDEANVLLGTTVAAGHKIRLQKDGANGSQYAIDFVNLEQATQVANPNPATYVVPAGFTQQDVQNALDKARMETPWAGVYLPAGDYQVSSKLQVYGKAIKVVGAGPWFTRFLSPSGQENTDVGFSVASTANGSSFSGFASFGNYTSRIDGPGKVFDLNGVSNITIDDVWVEHQMCLFWGSHVDHVTISNSRIRDTMADGVNMTNGSVSNHVINVEARATGDDGFALFAATDNFNGDQHDNVYENLSATLTWRAAGVAVYGGYGNTFRNIYIADMLTYSGITISSLDFGFPMKDFGASPPTQFQNISIVRAGGHFWGNQTFPGIWLFSASKIFQGIRISDVDIVDPTYSGIMFQTQYIGGAPVHPITDTILTNVRITGAHKSGDAFDAKSGFGIWVNELPEAGQGPAVGSATFTNLQMSDNFQNIKNTTTTFTINQN